MPRSPADRIARALLASATVFLLAGVAGDAIAHAQAQSRREFTVTARKFAFAVSGSDKAEIRVTLGDLVRITFQAEDIPHSFTTVETSSNPHYRIDNRAEPGKPVTFEFRADQAGTVPIRCTLALEPRCKEMTATLIVSAK